MSRHPARPACSFVAVAILALGLVADAAAANIGPNAGFESACGDPSTACQWASGPATPADRVVGGANSGSASLRLTTPSGDTAAATSSDCVTASASAGGIPLKFFYKTTSTEIQLIEVQATFYTGPSCSGTPTQVPVGPASIVRTGVWQMVSGSGTLAAATQSLDIMITAGCFPATCQSAAPVSFDDLTIDQGTTAVRLVAFSATQSRGGVSLSWRAPTAGAAGFNLYRSREGAWVRVNRSLIPARTGAVPSTYGFLDARGSGRGAYRLEAVSLSGARSWLGMAATRRGTRR